jgi:hypothetical protein
MITFRLPDGVDHRFGEGGEETVVELSDDAWDDFREERRTAFGLLYAGMVDVTKGRFEDLADWEAELRKDWEGRPIYDDTSAAAVRALDLTRSFRLGDDPDEMAAFLAATGFIHVRGVFDDGEVEQMRAEVERLKAAVRPNDGRSWWARDTEGRDVCCRVIYMSQQSAQLAAVPSDERMVRIVGLTGEPLRPADDRIDGLAAVIKNPGVVEGLSDLPWHRDCGLGGHPVLCPGLNVGVQLDHADAVNGQLHILAGSHHHSTPPIGVDEEKRWPVVALETAPGDVTAHFSHVFHAAPPPTGAHAGRRAMYVTYVTDALFDTIPEGRGYNDVVLNTPGQPRPDAIA